MSDEVVVRPRKLSEFLDMVCALAEGYFEGTLPDPHEVANLLWVHGESGVKIKVKIVP